MGNKWNGFKSMLNKTVDGKNSSIEKNKELTIKLNKEVTMDKFGKLVVDVPMKIMSGNRISHKKSHWVYTNYRNAWFNALGFVVKHRELAPGYRVSINIKGYYSANRMFDDVNFRQGCKPILDFFKQWNYMYDDSPNWLIDTYQQIRCAKGEERTVIEVM